MLARFVLSGLWRSCLEARVYFVLPSTSAHFASRKLHTVQRPLFSHPTAVDSPWVARDARAVENSRVPLTVGAWRCQAVAVQIAQCRIAPATPPRVLSVDYTCLAHNLDGRAWYGEMADVRGSAWMQGFFQQCELWVGFNQDPPLR